MEPGCVTCGKPKAVLACEICESDICKKCAQILDKDAFSYMPSIADDLKHTVYCESCFQEKVQPAQDEYEETMARAKDVWVFFTTQRKEIPLIKREKEMFEIFSCPDRDETILRMAFLSALGGFNALIDVEVSSAKVRNEGYQTSVWKGVGRAAQIDSEKLERQFLRNQIYR